MEIAQMTARRPYMLRAFYDWLVDNDLTPHLVVQATLAGVRVPQEFIQDGQIILNIAPRAVGNLELGNDTISFNARFGGRPHSVIVPLYAVLAIYARENGAGTMFEPEEAYTSIPGAEQEEDDSIWLEEEHSAPQPSIDLDDEPEPPRPKGRPSLRVVK
ncbi:TPA: ClpXP protease specificity-enhancing factor [Vibrio vulnificus]|uniref:ClpXP protease specificity-enhancing factor n=1 Tax=Vibrio vulnificus TaxID=672 RepID=UPI0010289AF2|nr:ClpXP protease specificity-enhancing factor [Vibrio vulnificus]EIN9354322.1 ClpXP protease specificity-enhancing factor [Vibrio vulnificus]ELC9573915.1 ClpXP protease specificity-enhancing factor [Vibrio vulnificus]ELV8583914.1 ClpXP protease specificity-enhancing factor [Vibrio vulnificus]ELV8628791.1 ClpXP protease specificity-enhancing factor [Vibrio vulnificus]ELV8638065.1 ClpXP protease specificity-enhancing factor [Vibrio vulnificus]